MNHRANLWGLVIGLLMVGVYLIVSFKKKKSPDLAAAAGIAIATVAATGGLRLIAFALAGDFSKVVAASAADGGLLALSDEDFVFVAIGGLALSWVSFQAVWDAFQKIDRKNPASDAPH